MRWLKWRLVFVNVNVLHSDWLFSLIEKKKTFPIGAWDLIQNTLDWIYLKHWIFLKRKKTFPTRCQDENCRVLENVFPCDFCKSVENLCGLVRLRIYPFALLFGWGGGGGGGKGSPLNAETILRTVDNLKWCVHKNANSIKHILWILYYYYYARFRLKSYNKI